MEWLDEILKDLENKEDLSIAISKELPKHFKPATIFNEANEKLKDANGKLLEMQGTIEGLSKSTGDIETLKVKLQTATADLETFKTNTQKRESTRSKQDALKNLLLSEQYNVNPKSISLLEKGIDYDSLTIDTNGQIIGLTDLANNLKTNYDFAFIKTTTQGTPPGSSNGNGEPETYQTKYEDARKSGNNLEMIRIKQEAFKENVILQ